METQTRKRRRRLPVVLLSTVALAALALAGWKVLPPLLTPSEPQPPEVVTTSTLQQMVAVSELSTFTAVYNGVATVPDGQDDEKVDYYVSYEATVKAGIDFEQIDFALDQTARTVRATLPPVHITQVNVDITTLDYIFLDPSKNTSAVSREAYLACEADVTTESAGTQAILDLAKQNAENMVTALLRPFLEQLEPSYQLQIDWEG